MTSRRRFDVETTSYNHRCLFCYVKDFMVSLSDNNQADVIEAFNSTSSTYLILMVLIHVISTNDSSDISH